MPPPILRYGLDPTGVNPDNLVMDEHHVLANRRIRAISPVEGAFYGDSLIVYEQTTGRILTKGTHYVPQEYYRTPSELYGSSVYGIILVIDNTVSSDVRIAYQVVGGIYSGGTETLKHLLEQVRDDGTEFNHYDVVGRPDAYDPTPHYHSLDNGMKFEYLVLALERIRNAILWADSAAYQDIYTYIQNLLNELDARLTHRMDSFITPLLYEFKRNFSKITIGLGNVENLSIATRDEGAKAGLSQTKINDFLERKYIALEAIVAFKDKLYEHLVSKEKTNIGRTHAVYGLPKKRTLFDLPNGAIITFPSKREATGTPDGFDSNAYPTDVGEDTRITIVKITNNRNNGGGVFLAYYNNGTQAYIGHSSTGTIAETITWKKFLFSEDIQNFVDQLSSHLTNTNNPHKTRKDQVGLSEVENLPVITREEILCLKSIRKYMTFDAFLLFMKAFMIGKNGSSADPGDESGEPLDNCQIIYCPCSPCGCSDGGTTAPTPEPSCPAYGTLKTSFCEGFTKWGTYHNGTCGTYNQLMASNAVDCGYVAPTNLTYGTKLGEFCDNKNLMGKYADGNGGNYSQVIVSNSVDCGYVAPTNIPYGTKITDFCDGKNLMGKYANGTGGTYNQLIATNAIDCGYVAATNVSSGTKLSEFCDNKNLMGKYADGNGGNYIQLIQANSPTCGPQQTCPASGTILGTVCRGKNLMNRVADGNCGENEVIKTANSSACGPQQTCPASGTILGTVCRGKNLMNRVADGNCGENEVIKTANDPTCSGPQAGKINYVIAVNPSSLLIGTTSSQFTGTLTGLVAGKSYTIKHRFKPAHVSNYIDYYNALVFTAVGTTHTYNFPINNYGDIPPGRADFVAEIVETNNSASKATSNTVSFTYIGDKKITFKINNAASGIDIEAGTAITTDVVFENFPAGKIISWTLHVYDVPGTPAPGVTTNSMGRGVFASTARVNDASVRGQQAFTAVATYAIGAWAGGGTKTVTSNVVMVNWTGGNQPSYPAAGTVLGESCSGSTMIITYANGSGGSYQKTFPNHPTCGGAPAQSCSATSQWSAVNAGTTPDGWIKVTGSFTPPNGSQGVLTAVSFSRDEPYSGVKTAWCTNASADVSQLQGLWGNVIYYPQSGAYGGSRASNEELCRTMGQAVCVKLGLAQSGNYLVNQRTVLINASNGQFYLEISPPAGGWNGENFA